jgi:hypothetical protein
MGQGVKSRKFGCYWTSMMLTAMNMPEIVDPKNKKHVEKVKQYKIYYNSFQHIIPCKYCRIFTKNVLMKKYPLQFLGRTELMHSIYIWKKIVSEKIINNGCLTTKPSPPFSVIYKKYDKLKAKCSQKERKCV